MFLYMHQIPVIPTTASNALNISLLVNFEQMLHLSIVSKCLVE